jgi:polyferredoxin
MYGIKNKLPYLLFGLIGSSIGILIYAVLPASVLHLNFGLMFEIFVIILVSIIFGLTLLALNFQKGAEVILLNTFLVFETRAMKLMIRKNLIAHTEANRLTAVIFSLTLGSVIFTMVAAALNVQLFTTDTTWGDIDLQIYVATNGEAWNSTAMDPVLYNYSSYI